MYRITFWRHKLFASTLVVFLAVAIVAVPLSFVWASPITRSAVMELTNNDRAQNGVVVLKTNYELTLAAQNKADDMIINGYWEHYHNGKTPWDWMHEAGYKFSSAGENLAIDFNDADSLMAAWMASTTHRENLLNPIFTEIGVGIAQGWFNDHQTTIVVQMFGRPPIKQVAAPTNNKQVNGVNNSVSDLYKIDQSKETGLNKLIAQIKNLYSRVYLKTIELFS